MIELKNVTKIYNSMGSSAVGLKSVNVKFNKGEFVGVIGPSGSGKTTLLNVVTGMDTYEEGELFLFGKDTSGYSNEDFEQYRRNNVSFIFQNYQLIDSYSVLDNVVIELLFKGIEKKEAIKQATEILDKVGLSHRLKNKASKLSGGEKQRVVIARALASDSQILACDEPTGNLDSANSLEIINLLKEISKEKLVLFVTHDTELLNDVATRTLTIKDGQIFSDELNKEIETDVEFEVVEKKVKFKTNVYIAFKNIFSTPKKTILLFLVFLLTSGYLIVNANSLNIDFSNSFKITEIYTNTTEHRVIVYGDVDYDSGIEVENDYFLDTTVKLTMDNPLIPVTTDQFYFSVLATDVYMGRKPERSTEIAISMWDFALSIMPEDIYKPILESGTVKATINGVEYTVVGIVAESDMYSGRVFFYNNEFPQYDVCLCNDMLFLDNNRLRTVYHEMDGTSDYLLQIPTGYDYTDYKITLGNLDVPITASNVIYGDDFKINTMTIYKFSLDNTYRSSFFFEDEYDAKKAYNHFQNEGYTVIYPDEFEYDKSLLYYLDLTMAVIQSISNTTVLIFMIIIVSVIAYLILKTSVKDFTIMRIIGLNSKDIFFILLMQIMSILAVASLVSFSAIFIMSKTYVGQVVMLEYVIKGLIQPANAIKTIGLLCLMGLSVTAVQHKKMFKKSASSNLRGGDLL